MRQLTADWVFDGNRIHSRAVLTLAEDGTVIGLQPGTGGTSPDAEYFEGLLAPGFINAHCHLELSHMKGTVPRGGGLVAFIMNLQRMRSDSPRQAMAAAEEEMLAGGIVAVGDIVNSPASFALKAGSQLIYHTFVEVFNLNPRRAAGIIADALVLQASAPGKHTTGIVPHAPYSVSKELFGLIAGQAAKNDVHALLSVHNQESAQEDRFYRTGDGEFARLYREFGVDISFYKPSGKGALATWLPWLDTPAKLLLVHNTYTNADDIALAAARGTTCWCLCPRANLYIEERLPDIPLFIEKGADLVLGTDSLAANDSLSILDEMKTISHHFPEIGLEQLLQWATRNGARFFNWNRLGSFEKGKCPGVNLLTGLDRNLRLGKRTGVKPLVGASR